MNKEYIINAKKYLISYVDKDSNFSRRVICRNYKNEIHILSIYYYESKTIVKYDDNIKLSREVK